MSVRSTGRSALWRLSRGLVAFGVACSGGVPAGPPDCSRLDGLDKDQCLHDELLAIPATDPDAVITKAGEISDPMVRQAAVSSWVSAHVNEVPMAKGKELCAQLEARDRGYCERRVSSPHLKNNAEKHP